MNPPARHLVLFDGECGLCNGFVVFALERDAAEQFAFMPLQSPAARALLERHGIAASLDTMWLVEDFRSASPRLRSRSRAALGVVRRLPGRWRWTGLLRFLPTLLLDGGYRLIAALRYRLGGQATSCALPRPEWRTRMLSGEQLRDSAT